MFFKYILFVYAMFVNYFSPDRIQKIDFEYDVDPDEVGELYGEFWNREKRWWSMIGTSSHYIRVKHDTVPYIPTCVKNAYYHVKYTFSNRTYRVVTQKLRKSYPDRSGDMGFKCPIESAHLMDEEEFIVRDVTKKMKQYHGPFCDYHGEDVPIKYLFMEDDYSHIRVKNLLGIEKTLPKDSSVRLLL